MPSTTTRLPSATYTTPCASTATSTGCCRPSPVMFSRNVPSELSTTTLPSV